MKHVFFALLLSTQGILSFAQDAPSFAKTSPPPKDSDLEMECPFNQTLTSKHLGSNQFSAGTAERVFEALNSQYDSQRKSFPQTIIRQDHKEIEFKSPVLKLRIQPTAFKSGHSCQRYFGQHSYQKVFTAQARNESECKGLVQKESSDWTQGTLVGSTTVFVSGDTPEGDDLYKKCPGNCSYSSEQTMMFSWDGRSCQLRLTLDVTCGAPKARNEFLASAELQHKHICELKR